MEVSTLKVTDSLSGLINEAGVQLTREHGTTQLSKPLDDEN